MKIKTTRKKLGLTQTQMAELLGTHQQNVSRIEVGQRSETREMVAMLRLLEFIYDKGLLDEFREEI